MSLTRASYLHRSTTCASIIDDRLHTMPWPATLTQDLHLVDRQIGMLRECTPSLNSFQCLPSEHFLSLPLFFPKSTSDHTKRPRRADIRTWVDIRRAALPLIPTPENRLHSRQIIASKRLHSRRALNPVHLAAPRWTLGKSPSSSTTSLLRASTVDTEVSESSATHSFHSIHLVPSTPSHPRLTTNDLHSPQAAESEHSSAPRAKRQAIRPI